MEQAALQEDKADLNWQEDDSFWHNLKIWNGQVWIIIYFFLF